MTCIFLALWHCFLLGLYVTSYILFWCDFCPLPPLLSLFFPLFCLFCSIFFPFMFLPHLSSLFLTLMRSSPLTSSLLLSSLSHVLSSGLWDTRDSSIQPGSLWAIIPGQALLCAMLGPPPNQRPEKGGVPSAAQTHAPQPVSQAWWWSRICSVEPPRSHSTRLPQAQFVCTWGTGLWGWPEQQVGEAERLRFAGCDSPFRAGCRSPAGSGYKAGMYCHWSQLVKSCRWSKRRNALNISTVSLSAFLLHVIHLMSFCLPLFLSFVSCVSCVFA